MDEFEKRDVLLLAVAADAPKKLKGMCNYGLSLISDLPKRKIMTAFKTKTINKILVDKIFGKQILAVPVTFLINSDGAIVWKYIGSRTERPPNQVLLDAIDKHL